VRRAVAIGFAVLLAAAGLIAQGFRFRGREPIRLDAPRNLPYDGRFTFVRLKYTTSEGGYWYRGLPSWAHGYPASEWNLMKIMKEVSYLNAHVEETNVNRPS